LFNKAYKERVAVTSTFTSCSSPCQLSFLEVVSSLCASIALASRLLLTSLQVLLVRECQLNSVLRLLGHVVVDVRRLMSP